MFDFDTKADREGLDSIKLLKTPKSVTESGHLTMWGAEFDFPTAPFVVDAITEWASKGLYAYTAMTEDFAANVCRWMQTQREWKIRPEWIVPTYGISASLAIAINAFTEPGSGVISFEPGYDNYWQAVRLCGRDRVGSRMIDTGQGYVIDWDDLEIKMADPSNRMIVLCNPHNPTGKVYSREELSRIAALAVKNDLIIFSDEIFAECVYTDRIEAGRVFTINQLNRDAKVIAATSLGKWLSFTGANQANMIIPDAAIRAKFTEARDRTFYGSMNPLMVPAYRAAYTEEGRQWIRELMEYIRGNYELVCEYFRRIQGFRVIPPQGTYVLWVDASEFSNDEEKLRRFLVEQAHFHVDMGMQYDGDPGFFRMNLALPRAELEKNFQSLISAVKEYDQSRIS